MGWRGAMERGRVRRLEAAVEKLQAQLDSLSKQDIIAESRRPEGGVYPVPGGPIPAGFIKQSIAETIKKLNGE